MVDGIRENTMPEDRAHAHIRVLLADLPAILAHVIMRQCEQQDDIEVIANVMGPIDTLRAAAEADVVVIGTSQIDRPREYAATCSMSIPS